MNTTNTGGTKPARWVTSFRLKVSPELYAEAQAVAAREQSTVSQVTRTALARYVKEAR